MFELSARLIGIYKVANQTRSVAIGMLTHVTQDSIKKLILGSLDQTDNKELSELQVDEDVPDASTTDRPPQSRRQISS